MRVNNDPFIVNQELNVSFNSSPQQLNQMFIFCIAGIITGTPGGNIKLQGSADPNSGIIYPRDSSWFDITGASTVSSAGTFAFNVPDVGYNWVRLVYTDTSSGASTAVMNATCNIKGL